MNLVIDVGNTRTKLAVFEGDDMVDFVAEEFVTISFLKDFFDKYTIANSIVSSVSFTKREIELFLQRKQQFY